MYLNILNKKNKLQKLIIILLITNTKLFAANYNNKAVVEDRSINLDSEISTTISTKNNNKYSQLNNSKNNWPKIAYNEQSNSNLQINEVSPQPVQNPIITSSDPEESNDNSNYNSEQALKEVRAMSMKDRVHRIENIIEAQKNLRLENKVRGLQEELQALRGVLETERHKVEAMVAQQKLLLNDLDRKLNQGKLNNNINIDSNGSKSSTATPSSQQDMNTSASYQDEKHDQQKLYTSAYQNIKTGNYSKAIELFNKYINLYPNGIFCANANYWLGEVYMLQSNYPKALAAFDQILIKYSQDPKSADALYKKGLINIYLKDFNKAKTILTEVKQKYKNTTAARLADKQLQSIESVYNAT